MNFARPEVMVFVFLAVGAVALYSYLSINSFVNARRREREAYYRNDTMRRLTESQGAGAEAALSLLREEDRLRSRSRLEGIKLGGLVVTAVGIALMIFLSVANSDNHLLGVAIGLIPFSVGIALLAYAYILARRPAADPAQQL